ncbi:unnamed protein product [Mesocestoides corti]|uniref:Replication stress response regulator SDE2 n=1 Tax=Mesocestoides corti TaxID=53468 RepID=A0A0R3UG07_MESCO|nr:unnamed protein product [Mesocestoides corti]
MSIHFLTRGQFVSASYKSEDCYFTVNGRLITTLEDLPAGDGYVIQVHHRLRGGKGGFGSMLRAIGNQIEKTNNHDMCRDLSGRRMRDVNAEEKLKEWYAKAGERERAKVDRYLEKQRRRREALEKGPLHDHKFDDPEFARRKERISTQLRDAVEAALEKIVSDAGPSEPAKKRSKLWIECLDEGKSSSSSDSDDCGGPSSLSDSDKDQDANSGSSEKPECPEIAATVKVDVPKSGQAENAPQGHQEHKIDKDITELTNPTCVPSITDEALNAASSSKDLESYGLERLKQSLVNRGLKCGGTLSERAARLFSVRGLEPSQYPTKIIAKSVKK